MAFAHKLSDNMRLDLPDNKISSSNDIERACSNL